MKKTIFAIAALALLGTASAPIEASAQSRVYNGYYGYDASPYAPRYYGYSPRYYQSYAYYPDWEDSRFFTWRNGANTN